MLNILGVDHLNHLEGVPQLQVLRTFFDHHGCYLRSSHGMILRVVKTSGEILHNPHLAVLDPEIEV